MDEHTNNLSGAREQSSLQRNIISSVLCPSLPLFTFILARLLASRQNSVGPSQILIRSQPAQMTERLTKSVSDPFTKWCLALTRFFFFFRTSRRSLGERESETIIITALWDLSFSLSLLLSVSFLSTHGIAALNLIFSEKHNIMMQGRSKRNIVRDRHRPQTQKIRRRGRGWIGREISLCETTHTDGKKQWRKPGKKDESPWDGEGTNREQTREHYHIIPFAQDHRVRHKELTPKHRNQKQKGGQRENKNSSTIEKLLLWFVGAIISSSSHLHTSTCIECIHIALNTPKTQRWACWWLTCTCEFYPILSHPIPPLHASVIPVLSFIVHSGIETEY